MSSRTIPALIAALVLILTAVPVLAKGGASDFSSYEWAEVNDNAKWEPRLPGIAGFWGDGEVSSTGHLPPAAGVP